MKSTDQFSIPNSKSLPEYITYGEASYITGSENRNWYYFYDGPKIKKHYKSHDVVAAYWKSSFKHGTCGKKMCNCCKKILNVDLFPVNKKRNNMLHSECKACKNKRSLICWKKYMLSDEFREKQNKRTSEYKRQNKDKIIDQRRKYYEKNQQKQKDATRAWKQNNKEKVVCQRSERRARMKGCVVERVDIEKIRSGNRCFWCGKKIKKGHKHVDHVMPLALGGSHSENNLVLSCSKCNLSKSAKHPNEWSVQGVFIFT